MAVSKILNKGNVVKVLALGILLAFLYSPYYFAVRKCKINGWKEVSKIDSSCDGFDLHNKNDAINLYAKYIFTKKTVRNISDCSKFTRLYCSMPIATLDCLRDFLLLESGNIVPQYVMIDKPNVPVIVDDCSRNVRNMAVSLHFACHEIFKSIKEIKVKNYNSTIMLRFEDDSTFNMKTNSSSPIDYTSICNKISHKHNRLKY